MVQGTRSAGNVAPSTAYASGRGGFMGEGEPTRISEKVKEVDFSLGGEVFGHHRTVAVRGVWIFRRDGLYLCMHLCSVTHRLVPSGTPVGFYRTIRRLAMCGANSIARRRRGCMR